MSDPSPSSVRARALVALVTLYLVWSSTYLALRHVVASMPPLLSGAVRFALAGAILFGVQRLRRAPAPAWADWPAASLSGVLLFTAANGMLCLAETRVTSSVAAVACATTPLFVIALNALRGERPSAGELAGVALGLAAVLLLGSGEALRAAGAHGALLLLSPFAWACGTIVARRAQPRSAVTFGAQQMVGGAVGNLVVGALLRERLPSGAPAVAVWSFGWLVLFGSVVAFPAFAYLVRHARPAVAMSYAYVNPVIAVSLGALLGGERVSARSLAALALVIVAVVASRPRSAKAGEATADPRSTNQPNARNDTFDGLILDRPCVEARAAR